MKILVTGAGGQLGRDLVPLLEQAGHQVIAPRQDALDLASQERVVDYVRHCRADWVINCAAYTQVDRAEEERSQAFQVNRDGARAVAEGVRAYGGRMLQVSTDFVFDGTLSRPYEEDDPANPINVYGSSKWQGELAVHALLPDAVVLRTAWVYGVHGANFVKTILHLAAEREYLQVVDNQVGTPTWTVDLAAAISALLEGGAEGVFHFTNEGVASWYDFAEAIVEEGRALGIPVKASVQPIPSESYPTPARRPSYSVLSKKKIRGWFAGNIPHWRCSLRAMLGHMQQAGVV